MNKANIKTKFNATLVATAIILLISAIMLGHVIISAIRVEAEKNAAAEIYRTSSLSPNGPKETWDEMLENIKKEFSNGSWAIRLASGNLDQEITFIASFAIILAFLGSIIAIRTELRLKEKKEKEKMKAEAKKAYYAEIKKIDESRKKALIDFATNYGK